MAVELCAPTDRETRLHVVRAARLAYRWAYSRAADTIQSGEVGQDVLWALHDDHALVFALCDGVSQSFFGDVAARILGYNLTRWLWDDPLAALPEAALRRKLNALLAELAPLATREVQQMAIPADTPAMVRAVLDQKRAIGSSAMFACGRIDPPSAHNPDGRLILAWVGDLRLRLWLDHPTPQGKQRQPVKLGGRSSTHEQWSTLSGLVGTDSIHLYLSAVQDPQGSLAQLRVFSDGLKQLDQAGPRLTPAEIDAALATARQAADSDDSSWFEAFFDPDEVAADIAAQAHAAPVESPPPTPQVDPPASPHGAPPLAALSPASAADAGLASTWQRAVARYGRLPIAMALGAVCMAALLGLAMLPLLTLPGGGMPEGDGTAQATASTVQATASTVQATASTVATQAGLGDGGVAIYSTSPPEPTPGSSPGRPGAIPTAITPTLVPLRAFAVTGSVVAREGSGDLRPLANLQVALINEADRLRAVDRTDQDGRFELTGQAASTTLDALRLVVSDQDTRTWGLAKLPPERLTWVEAPQASPADALPAWSARVDNVILDTDHSPSDVAVVHADIWFDADGDGAHDPEEAAAPDRRLMLIEIDTASGTPTASKLSDEVSDRGGHVALAQSIQGAADVSLALDSGEPCWVDTRTTSTSIVGGRVYHARCAIAVPDEEAAAAPGAPARRADVRGRLVAESATEATGSAVSVGGYDLRLLGGLPAYVVASARSDENGSFAFLAVPDGDYCVELVPGALAMAWPGLADLEVASTPSTGGTATASGSDIGLAATSSALTSGCLPPARQIDVQAGQANPSELVLTIR